MGEASRQVPFPEKPSEKRLGSWKEIATYVDRDVTTVQRWEKREAMPVHRHVHDKRGSVYALTGELDAWLASRSQGGERSEEQFEATPAPAASRPREAKLWSRSRVGLAVLAAFALLAVSYLMYRERPKQVARPGIRSLAVLPLRNLSGDSTQEYVADGLTEALIGRLSRIHDLRVISHTSVMRFQNPQRSVPEIAKTLGVDAIVEGSVIRDGNRIRVTAQLIRAATDEHFWSETYDRQMQDMLSLESELAESIAEKVEVTVTGEERRLLKAKHRVAPEVYESYLKGRFALRRRDGRAGVEQSITYFDDAISRDQSFAPAYLGLAEAYVQQGTVFVGAPPAAARLKAMSAVGRALELDSDIADAHILQAQILQREWHWSQAETEYRRALQLNPNDAEAYAAFASWLLCEGRTDEAVATIEHGRELDPVAVAGFDIAWIFLQSRRFNDAIREFNTALEANPNDANALTWLGLALLENGQPGGGVSALEKAVSISKGSPAATGVLIAAYARAGRRPDAIRLLDQLKERSKTAYVPPAAFVNAYLGLGQTDEAFAWLEQAFAEKSNILQFVKVHPFFDPIRNDPRFADLVRRVGLG